MRAILLLVAFASAVVAQPKVTAIAGNGVAGYSESQINNPYGLVIGPDGALYICEIGNHVVRRLDLKSRKLTTVAGNAKSGYSGDGGPATSASLNEPYEIAFDGAGNMYFVEMRNHLIRRVDRKTGIISTVAGSGQPGDSGDGGPATKAQFRQPHSIAFDRRGRLLVCDIGNNRIRRIDMKAGTIDSIFTGTKGTPTSGPRAIAVGPKGDLYVAFREGNSVYRMGEDGQLDHLAGTGEQGYTGDGGPAKQAKLSGPKGISLAGTSLYIADTESHTIRRISLTQGSIETVAGNGQRGNGGDGDPKQCMMNRPHGVFADKNGAVYVGDSEAHKVRVIR
jgi:DNA-binding beta-propeller fold protein YncE